MVYTLCVVGWSGTEKFDSLTNFYCRNARAALICYGSVVFGCVCACVRKRGGVTYREEGQILPMPIRF